MATAKARELLAETLRELKDCTDLNHRRIPAPEIDIVYFGHLTRKSQMLEEVLEPLGRIADATAVATLLSQSQYKQVAKSGEVVQGVLAGQAAIFFHDRAFLYDAYSPESRSIEKTDIESVISGPQDSLTESLSTNLSLIRRRLKDSRLKAISYTIGSKSATKFNLLYMEGVADPQEIDHLRADIGALDVEIVLDSNILVQYLQPSLMALFPLYLTSVRPDLIVGHLAKGKVVGLLDGSQNAFIAPSTFFEFFSSPDDYYQPWLVGTIIRLLRFIALFITLGFTALYVDIVTYHYEVIPPSLLINLLESRSKVPFSPLLEAMFMELTIELIREAGARLPSKVGMTIGTVGGIVIGQAAVQAGITSNILIIAVAISTIASFVTPSYLMNSAIRLYRFIIIVMAGFMADFGLVLGFAFTVVQVAGFGVYGKSYLFPISAKAPGRWLDLFLRAPIKTLERQKKKTAGQRE